MRKIVVLCENSFIALLGLSPMHFTPAILLFIMQGLARDVRCV